MARDAMELAAGSVFFRDGTQVPVGVEFKSAPVLPGWRIITGASSADVNCEISRAGWHFFYLAEQLRAGAFAFDQTSARRKALAKIARMVDKQNKNAFEITGIQASRLAGLHNVTLTAHARHIQRTPFLFEAPEDVRPAASVRARRVAA
jgi:hypothetical protein